jgi:hypothetical protein
MRKLVLAAVSAVSLTAGAALFADHAQAAPLFDGLQGVAPPSNIANVQFFFFQRHRYCWYWDGWRGPGWYWCGYEWRDGFGWGGAYGWEGWTFPGYAAGYRRHFHGRRPHGPGPGPGGPGHVRPLFNRGGNGPVGGHPGPRFNRGGNGPIGGHPGPLVTGGPHGPMGGGPHFSVGGGGGPRGGGGGGPKGGGGGGGGGGNRHH